MQNSERPKFEESWKSAFDGAEMAPSDQVWNAIEVDLAGQESAVMKKRVVFYQRLAAATVTFALLSGLYAFYVGSDHPQQIATNPNTERPVNQEKPSTATHEATTPRTSPGIAPDIADNALARSNARSVSPSRLDPASGQVNDRTKSSYEHSGGQIPIQPAEDHPASDPAPLLTGMVPASDNQEKSGSTVATVSPTQSQDTEPKIATDKPVASPILQTAPLVASLDPDQQPEKKESRKNQGESLWLALAGAAGSYAPNTAQVNQAAPMSGAMFDNAAAAPQGGQQIGSSREKVGTSYSVGLAFGKRVGRRLVLQSGLNLAKQQIDYTTNFDATAMVGNTTTVALAEYASLNTKAFNRTNTYTVNSAMELVSIPMMAGYLIVDRQFGWQMNAGISSDIFLRNTLVDKSGQRESFTQSAGSDSPYRTLNWSGLLNTELSYKIGQHYRFSVVPGVRYSFNPLQKEPGSGGRPMFLDLGFRFCYMFE